MLALLPQLEKRKVFEPAVLEQLRRYAQTENLKRKALDGKSLREYWERLPSADRKDGRVAAAAAQCFIALGGCAEAHRIIEESLEESWDSDAAAAVRRVPAARCAHASGARRRNGSSSNPGDPVLLLAWASSACSRNCGARRAATWRRAWRSSPAIPPTSSLGKLLERIGKPEEASPVYRRGLELALAQLKECTGGRRKAAL